MRVIFSGGGTGGHIYPALAVIERMKERHLIDELLYVGTKKGLESKIVPQKGIPFTAIELQGFKRSLSLDNIKTITLFLKSVRTAKKLIRQFKPDVVVGTGGYVSSAVLYAAARLHIPTVINEQNSVAGITNRFLGHFVDKVSISFQAVADQFPATKIVLTGNPRGQQFAGIKPNDRLKDFGLQQAPTLLIFGGSRGAERINQAFLSALPQLNEKKYQVLFVSGQVHFAKIQASLKGKQVNSNIAIVPYIDDMPTILPDVAVILGRAGATSLAEITALGIPSILVPSPYVTNDHQTKNAQSLVDKNAARLVTEEQLTGETLVTVSDDLMQNEAKRQEMGQNAKAIGVPDAADRFIKVMQDLI
ncbi:UDP-N-acetylglucosamine--N-acetylmuramyl-(pentapeptide) pyrophosphoryl-undecaprenol N-acetylglucosamine transferase [Loigolactobacillus backii]|uniref:UDP-N-acetylglucosamine--N-acetylmuramyl-(pentapeptide) pyrophosphoryl-undecaprenol N-acetylglucosamine transferase n=1 Tax=Loigolactobacillus backii TaxID=375175 RepID=A0A192H4G7_9LACO|nr:undecaprenyldiphospho-muramoylpentapeptide beta-N-acetylglucosaminyltransferase [Loigolactobacillus backii]ANK63143.1 UDP-N-acetylglucosamine--N-acetylmuramyl-(pentapeptide) pyrophosphoryl-undecaprenol N-acetylglucosamine transferase [Loigolactobacillus backii]ANK69849.1 UDP-N-acetylglucosamine--N-acetylmuramyl-(pentapeptide) pyrophosphoryl-undecaprenol N-acetylglucosamine transferase [Loigolactobacillus backii]